MSSRARWAAASVAKDAKAALVLALGVRLRLDERQKDLDLFCDQSRKERDGNETERSDERVNGVSASGESVPNLLLGEARVDVLSPRPRPDMTKKSSRVSTSSMDGRRRRQATHEEDENLRGRVRVLGLWRCGWRREVCVNMEPVQLSAVTAFQCTFC